MMRWLIALLLLGLATPAAAQPRLAPGEHRFAVGPVTMWYRVAGQGAGVPLVFLHGGPGEGSQAFQVVGGPELERTQRIVYFDQRGAGRSNRPKGASFYSIDILVEDIDALRKALGVEKIALLGHSFGTILAMEYAARHPERTHKVVLAAAVPDFPRMLDLMCERLAKTDPEAHARAVAAGDPATAIKCNAFSAYQGDRMKAYVVANMFPDPRTGERVEALDNAGGLANTGEQNSALFGQGLLTYRLADPARIRAPVLVIAGGKDFQAVIEPQRTLARAVRRGRLIEYRDNGHFMFVEDPARFARDVGRFLRGR
jgi:proline iminopeptidase